MEGEIDSPSMSSLIELAVMHDSMLSTQQMTANVWRRFGLRLFHGMRRNSKSGAAAGTSPIIMISATNSTPPGWTRR